MRSTPVFLPILSSPLFLRVSHYRRTVEQPCVVEYSLELDTVTEVLVDGVVEGELTLSLITSSGAQHDLLFQDKATQSQWKRLLVELSPQLEERRITAV